MPNYMYNIMPNILTIVYSDTHIKLHHRKFVKDWFAKVLLPIPKCYPDFDAMKEADTEWRSHTRAHMHTV